MKTSRLSTTYLAMVTLLLVLTTCGSKPLPAEPTDSTAEYLGMRFPRSSPEVFAPDLLPPKGMLMHSSPAFSPDGTEAYFSAYDPLREARLDTIMFTQRQGERWSSPQLAAFSGEFNDEWPWFAPDGDRTYFTSRRPTDPGGAIPEDPGLWFVERREPGWSAPRQILSRQEFGRNEGTIYVAAIFPGGHGDLDIYSLEWLDGTYSMPSNLGPAVNTAAEEYAPWAAPDDSYLVFTRLRAAPQRSVSLFVSFHLADGTWSEAQDMGESVGALRGGRFPVLSPDGKVLFFVAEGGEAIYWVDASIVELFRSGP